MQIKIKNTVHLLYDYSQLKCGIKEDDSNTRYTLSKQLAHTGKSKPNK